MFLIDKILKICYYFLYFHIFLIHMRIRALHCVLLAMSCSASAAEGEKTQVYSSNGQLEYVGSIDTDANQRLFDLYEQLSKKPTTLSIRSLGGNVDPGMELGAWVRAQKLNVKVMEFCFSSCFPEDNSRVH